MKAMFDSRLLSEMIEGDHERVASCRFTRKIIFKDESNIHLGIVDIFSCGNVKIFSSFLGNTG